MINIREQRQSQQRAVHTWPPQICLFRDTAMGCVANVSASKAPVLSRRIRCQGVFDDCKQGGRADESNCKNGHNPGTCRARPHVHKVAFAQWYPLAPPLAETSLTGVRKQNHLRSTITTKVYHHIPFAWRWCAFINCFHGPKPRYNSLFISFFFFFF